MSDSRLCVTNHMDECRGRLVVSIKYAIIVIVLNRRLLKMVEGLPPITLKAIGIVRNEVKQPPGSGYDWER